MGVRQSVAARTLRTTPGSKARRGEAAQKRWAVCYTTHAPCNTARRGFVRPDTDRPAPTARDKLPRVPGRRPRPGTAKVLRGPAKTRRGTDEPATRFVESACGPGAGPRPRGPRTPSLA